jgi:hypothetical protein
MRTAGDAHRALAPGVMPLHRRERASRSVDAISTVVLGNRPAQRGTRGRETSSPVRPRDRVPDHRNALLGSIRATVPIT